MMRTRGLVKITGEVVEDVPDGVMHGISDESSLCHFKFLLSIKQSSCHVIAAMNFGLLNC